MNTELNWIAILIANVVGNAIAFVWYNKKTFGLGWEKITGITKAGRPAFIQLMITNFITAIGLNFVLNISKPYHQGSYIGFSLLIGFVLWLAFSAATLIQHNAFEHKAPKLTMINVGYQLVLYLGMALVFGLFE